MSADHPERRDNMTAANIVTPIPLLTASLRLTAIPAAVAYSRTFVRHTLTRWQLEEHADTTTLIMSELVTNAIRATGITDVQPKSWQIKPEHVIGIQLRAIGASLYAEVWDRMETAPTQKNPTLEETSGRGLLLVDELAKQWNVYRSPFGGKVVWAELPIGAPVETSSFNQLHPSIVLPIGIQASRGPVEDQARTALFDHLLETTLSAMAASRRNDAV